MKPWAEITPQEFAAMDESEKRELARKILEDAFGPPVNAHRAKIIEGILNANYGPAPAPGNENGPHEGGPL